MGEDLASHLLVVREYLDSDASDGADEQRIRVHDLLIAKEGADAGPFQARRREARIEDASV